MRGVVLSFVFSLAHDSRWWDNEVQWDAWREPAVINSIFSRDPKQDPLFFIIAYISNVRLPSNPFSPTHSTISTEIVCCEGILDLFSFVDPPATMLD